MPYRNRHLALGAVAAIASAGYPAVETVDRRMHLVPQPADASGSSSAFSSSFHSFIGLMGGSWGSCLIEVPIQRFPGVRGADLWYWFVAWGEVGPRRSKTLRLSRFRARTTIRRAIVTHAIYDHRLDGGFTLPLTLTTEREMSQPARRSSVHGALASREWPTTTPPSSKAPHFPNRALPVELARALRMLDVITTGEPRYSAVAGAQSDRNRDQQLAGGSLSLAWRLVLVGSLPLLAFCLSISPVSLLTFCPMLARRFRFFADLNGPLHTASQPPIPLTSPGGRDVDDVRDVIDV
uniref:Uncharacterized protein n=1 Tax=Anopheles atroparvus TaxID=41427 RepID=A0A182J7M9_ANOAO